MRYASILSTGVYLPSKKVSNAEIAQQIQWGSKPISGQMLESLFGAKSRHFASKNTQVSDLAVNAANQALAKSGYPKIDLLIFAAASSDLIEPATANIIQSKLGLTCPAMDIKNACNSFASAIEVASAFVVNGMYKNILITSGEKLSEVINFHPRNNEHFTQCLPGYSLGDAGAAMIISSNKNNKVIFQRFLTIGQHWNLCTVLGGGSIAFRNASKYYFEGDSVKLTEVFNKNFKQFFENCLQAIPWGIDEINCVVAHQVASHTTSKLSKILNIPKHKFVQTFADHGNIAAATIPLALNQAVDNGQLKKGDKLLVIGLAAGISISIQFIQW